MKAIQKMFFDPARAGAKVSGGESIGVVFLLEDGSVLEQAFLGNAVSFVKYASLDAYFTDNHPERDGCGKCEGEFWSHGGQSCPYCGG